MEGEEEKKVVPEEETRREEGHRRATSDRALVRLDEKEILARMTEAWDAFIELGFASHLIGLRARSAREYRIALYPDGVESIPSEVIQEVADEFRLDYTIERGDGIDGWAIVCHPRW